MTPAARIRALHAAEPALTRRQLADRVSAELGRPVPYTAVQSALRGGRTSRLGRPPKRPQRPGGAPLLRERDLPAHVLELARAEATREGVALRTVLADAVAAGVLPAEGRPGATSRPAGSRRARSSQP